MKAFSLTVLTALTGHDSAQLNRKAIVAPKAFSFHLISLPGLKMIAANFKKHLR